MFTNNKLYNESKLLISKERDNYELLFVNINIKPVVLKTCALLLLLGIMLDILHLFINICSNCNCNCCSYLENYMPIYNSSSAYRVKLHTMVKTVHSFHTRVNYGHNQLSIMALLTDSLSSGLENCQPPIYQLELHTILNGI